MSILTDIMEDINDITGDTDGFAVSITLTPPGEDVTPVTITGLHTKHHLQVDETGKPVNSKNAHISFYEKTATAAGYVVRNSEGEVALKGHKVMVKDSTGNNKYYSIDEAFPSETVGLIVCILGDHVN